MSTTEDASKVTTRPELVKMNTAFKLAEKWVSNMTATTVNESTRVVLEAPPPRPCFNWGFTTQLNPAVAANHLNAAINHHTRLGIGAVVPRHQPNVALSHDLIERKLRALTDAENFPKLRRKIS